MYFYFYFNNLNTSLNGKQDKAWTLLDTKTGITSISLSGVTFTEIEIIITNGTNRFKFHILASELSTTGYNYRGGYAAATSNVWGVIVSATNSSIQLIELYNNGINYLTSSTITVYYR